MNRYRAKYNDGKIIYMGDTNLVSKNAFWPEVLKAFPGAELLIDEPTTLSPARYMSNKSETNGVANDYDHFILDRSAFDCDEGQVYNYYKEAIYKDIETRYVIRKEVVGFDDKNFHVDGPLGLTPFDNVSEDISPTEDGDLPPVDDSVTIKLDYALTVGGEKKMNKFVAGFESYLTGLYTVKKNEVVADDFQIQERLDGLKRRVFLRQLTNPFYYRFMQEVLSDHFPVSLNCKI